jgi:uncharacterized protein
MLHFVVVVSMFSLLVYVVNRDVSSVTPPCIRIPSKSKPDPVTTGGTSERIDWSVLRRLNPHTGEAPEELRRLDGRAVAIPGYAVPLEDDAGRVSEMLLVPYFGACIHTPPPPGNQMVMVTMKGSAVATPEDAVWIHGTLHIASRDSAYGRVSYQLEGTRLEAYRD